MNRAIVGIFVGGQSKRMGGEPKGLLCGTDGQPLVVRLIGLCREALGTVDVVLVGDAKAYGELALTALADDPPGIGPLGGLCALLIEAQRRASLQTFALACDLPYVTAQLLGRLRDAHPDADAVVPRRQSVWEPLFARYAPSPALAAARRALAHGRRALHDVVNELGSGALELALEPGELELLDDWDTPENMHR